MTWSADTEARAEAILERYPQKRSALMPLLYLAMIEAGYLTVDGMRRVADLTGVTPAQVQAVASFYNMFKTQPVGRYLVSVCTSISCMLLGGDEVLHAIERASGVPAGEMSEDGLISVEHAECIGACGGAPACLVNYELIEGITAAKVGELINWLRNGRPEAVNTDEMQQLFGGARSFDWAIPEESAASSAVPSFGPLGNDR